MIKDSEFIDVCFDAKIKTSALSLPINKLLLLVPTDKELVPPMLEIKFKFVGSSLEVITPEVSPAPTANCLIKCLVPPVKDKLEPAPPLSTGKIPVEILSADKSKNSPTAIVLDHCPARETKTRSSEDKSDFNISGNSDNLMSVINVIYKYFYII